MNTMKTYTLDEMINKHVGVPGATNREMFETKLKMDVISHKIKEVRKKSKTFEK